MTSPRARARTTRRTIHANRRAATARSAWTLMNARYDYFRRLADELPEEFREEMAGRLTIQIDQMIQDLETRGDTQ